MAERDFQSNVNGDGLRQTYGQGEAMVRHGGSYTEGGWNVFTATIIHDKLSTLAGTADPTTVLDWHSRIPSGAYIGKGTLFVEETFVSAGTSGTLDIGLALASDQEYALTHTNTADDAIDSAIAESALVAGASITLDGVDIEAVLPSVDGGYLVTAEVGTEDFTTSGVARLEIHWRAASDESDT